jgi:hypothetical protein
MKIYRDEDISGAVTFQRRISLYTSYFDLIYSFELDATINV